MADNDEQTNFQAINLLKDSKQFYSTTIFLIDKHSLCHLN